MSDFFIKAKIKHNNKYEYSNVEYVNSITKVGLYKYVWKNNKKAPL